MTATRPVSKTIKAASPLTPNRSMEGVADREPLLPLQVEQQTTPRQEHQKKGSKMSTSEKIKNCSNNLCAFVAMLITCPVWVGCFVLLSIKSRFTPNSDDPGSSPRRRVKSIAFCESESWIIGAVYSGHILLWNDNEEDEESNLDSKTNHNCICVSQSPVRCVKVIERMNLFVTASDDGKIRVFRITALEPIVQLDAHEDYIRDLAVHPELPYLLSCSDDMTIKCWDTEYNFSMKFALQDAHDHYIMQVKVNPHDSDLFASASLDRTIKVWKLGRQDAPLYTLEGHGRGINSIDFCPHDKRYLVSGSYDKTVKVWNLENKTVVQSLRGHSHYITSVMYHPTLPVLVSASEDGTCRFWKTSTEGGYKEVMMLEPSLNRVWALSCSPSDSAMAIGCDEGCMRIDIGWLDDAQRELKVRRQRTLPLAEGGCKDEASNC